MNLDNLTGYAIPVIVAVLTGLGGVLGISFRDADATERRRGMWLYMLALLAAIATSAAINSASGFGKPLSAVLMSIVACAVAIGTHVLWRRFVFDAPERNIRIAMTAVGLAVVVIISSVTYTYIAGKGCRQAQGLIATSMAQSAFILPSFSNQGPTTGDYQKWSRDLHDQAAQVTAGDVAPKVKELADLADQITATEQIGDSGTHALLGARFYDVLRVLLQKCQNI
jgi:peptidoglycan/LPS O-acetylase OafA/YrhL